MNSPTTVDPGSLSVRMLPQGRTKKIGGYTNGGAHYLTQKLRHYSTYPGKKKDDSSIDHYCLLGG